MIQLLYFATENSDLTEGRGHPVIRGIYADPEEAVKAVRGRGVMGVGDGEVYAVSLDHGVYRGSILKRENLYYGYRQVNGRWGYYFAAQQDDPEWLEYQRLKKKFG